MDFLRNVKAELDAKIDFGIPDWVSELWDFCRDDLCILTVIAMGRVEWFAEHSSVDSRNASAECKEL
jgi:hypothetical protein